MGTPTEPLAAESWIREIGLALLTGALVFLAVESLFAESYRGRAGEAVTAAVFYGGF